MKHSPAPWRVHLHPDRGRVDGRRRPCICTASGGTIATLADGRSQDKANAHLIAASPDLLAALYELITARDYTLEHGGDILTSCSWAKAESAVVKAQPD